MSRLNLIVRKAFLLKTSEYQVNEPFLSCDKLLNRVMVMKLLYSILYLTLM